MEWTRKHEDRESGFPREYHSICIRITAYLLYMLAAGGYMSMIKMRRKSTHAMLFHE